MSDIFIKIINLCISGSVLIIITLLLRNARRIFSGRGIMLLWLIVAIRLICPFSIETQFSASTNNSYVTSEKIYSVVSSNDEKNDSLNIITPSQKDGVDSLLEICSVTWICVAAVILFYGVIAYCITKRKLSDSVPVSEGIWRHKTINDSFSIGVIKPRIYIAENLSESEINYVVEHERCHIRHKDNFTKMLAFVICAVYWFNPLIWIAYKIFCADQEYFCDECVIKRMGKSEIKNYAEVIIENSKTKKGGSIQMVSFGSINPKSRIKKLLSNKKRNVFISIVAACAIMLVAVFFLTSPISGKDNGETKPTQEPTISGTSSAVSEEATTESNTTKEASADGYYDYFSEEDIALASDKAKAFYESREEKWVVKSVIKYEGSPMSVYSGAEPGTVMMLTVILDEEKSNPDSMISNMMNIALKKTESGDWEVLDWGV